MKKKNNQGFSLVELLIAIVILALIMVALASFLATTTKTYTRTRNNIEVQRTGQEVYDMIADKIMQASEIRVIRNGKEYACVGVSGSNAVDEDGFLVIHSDAGDVQVTSVSGYPLCSFSALTEENTPIDCIAVVYEQKLEGGYVTPGGVHLTAAYQKMLDIYYFDNVNHEVYMSRKELWTRNDSVGIAMGQEEDSNNAEAVKTITDVTEDTIVLDNVGNAIRSLSAYSATDLKNMLVARNIESLYAYAIPSENAIYLDIQVEKQSMEKNSAGMITVRNSYVLEPKNAPEPITDDGSV